MFKMLTVLPKNLECSGRQQAARGPKLSRQQSYLARARSHSILKADGSEINLSWQQQLLTIR